MLRDARMVFMIGRRRLRMSIEEILKCSDCDILCLRFGGISCFAMGIRCFLNARRGRCRRGLRPCLSMYLLREDEC